MGIMKRLFMSRANKPPVPISKIAKQMMHPTRKGLTSVVVGTVTNDIRHYNVPKNLKICALHVTDAARARIEAKGGEVMTFDQLATQNPTGKKTVLLQGARRAGVPSGKWAELQVCLAHTLS